MAYVKCTCGKLRYVGPPRSNRKSPGLCFECRNKKQQAASNTPLSKLREFIIRGLNTVSAPR